MMHTNKDMKKQEQREKINYPHLLEVQIVKGLVGQMQLKLTQLVDQM